MINNSFSGFVLLRKAEYDRMTVTVPSVCRERSTLAEDDSQHLRDEVKERQREANQRLTC